MSLDEKFRLYTLGATLDGDPAPLPPTTFSEVGAMEVEHIERWVARDPSILGEELLVVARQFAGWDRTGDRPDLLALDREGRTCVIELKRDSSGNGQDLQAIRYAAYVSGLDRDKIATIYAGQLQRDTGAQVSDADALEQIEEFIGTEGLHVLDDPDQDPRIILVARRFLVGVTNTVLWLRGRFDLDITCVQLTPFEHDGQLFLAADTIIPLPTAKDYEVAVREKRQRSRSRNATSLDWEMAKAFIASVPPGRWTTYGEVADAAGNRAAPVPVGNWLARPDNHVPGVHRVLRESGQVSPGWQASDPGLPATPEGVQELLASENVEFAGRRARADQRWTADDWRATLEP